jgi:hypothetical protein
MAITRRSIGETLTEAQQAFLSPSEAARVGVDHPAGPVRPRRLNDRDADVAVHRPRALTRSRQEASRRAPASPARPAPLHSVTLRLTPAVADALRRASIERSLDYVGPFTQQAIVEAALRTWLEGQGYRPEE